MFETCICSRSVFVFHVSTRYLLYLLYLVVFSESSVSCTLLHSYVFLFVFRGRTRPATVNSKVPTKKTYAFNASTCQNRNESTRLHNNKNTWKNTWIVSPKNLVPDGFSIVFGNLAQNGNPISWGCGKTLRFVTHEVDQKWNQDVNGEKKLPQKRRVYRGWIGSVLFTQLSFFFHVSFEVTYESRSDHLSLSFLVKIYLWRLPKRLFVFFFWSKQVANAFHLFGTVYVEYALVCFGLFMKSPLAKLPKIWDWAILTSHLFPNGRCNLSLTECQKKRRVSTFFFLGQGLNIYPLHLLYGIYLPTFTMKIN